MKLGNYYFFVCPRFFYWGRLQAWSDDSFFLTDAYIVYETGPWKDTEWQTMEKLPCDWAVSRAAVESWGEGKCPSWVRGSLAASGDTTVTSPKPDPSAGSPSGPGPGEGSTGNK